MNLIDGKIFDTSECDAVLEQLEQRIITTLSKPRVSTEQVIMACDKLVASFNEDEYLSSSIKEFSITGNLIEKYVAEARAMFSEEALRYRVKKELGDNFGFAQSAPSEKGDIITEWILPLGVLLHIAAGNADGLPAFSVLEGLLAGNINILKLPASEGGISVRILMELIRIEPALAEYIYVFDYSSKDIVHMNKLIGSADAVVVWGGIEAVTAFRALLPPNVKLIEWGHKVGFAYVTMDAVNDNELYEIAVNMVSTGQLLCSSCQGVFLDTEDTAELYNFCKRFLSFFERAVEAYAGSMDIGMAAQSALQRRATELETIYTGNKVFGGKECYLIAGKDQILEPSTGFASAWVKMLPRKDLVKTLRPYKNYLQTAALICDNKEKAELTATLLRTGIVRICSGVRMSAAYSGQPHDGEYPLRRYTKITAVE